MASSFIVQCLTSLLLFSLLPSFSFSFTSPPPSPIRAVNLGGWLVTEGWMTPWLFNNIKNKDLLDGTQVQFKSVAHNKYLTAENGGGAVVVATRADASGWETFKLWRTQDAKFQFKVFYNQFIGLDNQGQGGVVAIAFSPGNEETFEVVRNSANANRVRIRAPNGLFLLTKLDGSVIANAPEDTDWGDNDSSVFLMTIVPHTTKDGEFQLTNGFGKEAATAVLREHWNSYIVEDDFKFMSENGINAVRIPVGYWIAKGDDPPLPFVGGSLQVLDRAFDWAEKYGLGVIVDLHAAPGSQNGNSHSGTRDGSQDWGSTGQNIYDTVAVIDFLSSRYARRQGLLAMELINEPMAPRVTLEDLKKYYQNGYNAVRKYSACYVILSNRLGPHDPTELLQFASSLDGTVIDVHYYNLYDPIFQNKSLQENIDYVYKIRTAQIDRITQANGPLVFVGEWTAALDHSSDQDSQKFAVAELDVFGRASSFGWAYWSYRNANPQWSMKHMIKNGLISLKKN